MCRMTIERKNARCEEEYGRLRQYIDVILHKKAKPNQLTSMQFTSKCSWLIDIDEYRIVLRWGGRGVTIIYRV